MITYPLLMVFLPIISAIFIYIMGKSWANRLVFATQLALSLLYLQLIAIFPVLNSKSLVIGDWTLQSGIALKIDNLSMAFIGLAIFMWWMVILYAWPIYKKDNKFLFFLLFLEGTFLGLLMVNDLFSMFVFIDIITILSAILVVYKKDGWSLRSGLYYLMINSMGMLTYLMGFVIVYMLTGTLNWDLATERLSVLPLSPSIYAAYILMSASVSVKAAFFPTFNWLSRAHGSAPASISALLSGLLVKGGLYAFIRIQELFSRPMMGDFFFHLGLITALSGVIFALSQKDIKQMLAFSTISQIGLMLMGISQIQTNIYYGGLIHLFNHALFKALLFLGAGILINHYKTRRLTQIRGVFQAFPLLSVTLFIGMLSITGAPFFNGYIGKYILSTELASKPLYFSLYHLVNLGTIMTYMKFSQIFFLPNEESKPFLPDPKQWGKMDRPRHIIPSLILAFSCLFATFGFSFLGNLVQADFPTVRLFSATKYVHWSLTVILAYILTKAFIFTDRITHILHAIREVKIPFYHTAYMFILLLASMLVFAW